MEGVAPALRHSDAEMAGTGKRVGPPVVANVDEDDDEKGVNSVGGWASQYAQVVFCLGECRDCRGVGRGGRWMVSWLMATVMMTMQTTTTTCDGHMCQFTADGDDVDDEDEGPGCRSISRAPQ